MALTEAHQLMDSFCAPQIFLLNKDVRGANKVHQLYWVREKQEPHIRRVSDQYVTIFSVKRES